MQAQMQSRIQLAAKGRDVWNKAIGPAGFSFQDAVVLLPEGEAECHYYTLLHMSEFLRVKHKQRVYVVFTEDYLKRNIPLFDFKADLVQIDKADMEALICYISLFCNDEDVFISSTVIPVGRNAGKLIQEGYFTVESYAAVGILRLQKALPPEKLEYAGNGIGMKAFLNAMEV